MRCLPDGYFTSLCFAFPNIINSVHQTFLCLSRMLMNDPRLYLLPSFPRRRGSSAVPDNLIWGRRASETQRQSALGSRLRGNDGSGLHAYKLQVNHKTAG